MIFIISFSNHIKFGICKKKLFLRVFDDCFQKFLVSNPYKISSLDPVETIDTVVEIYYLNIITLMNEVLVIYQIRNFFLIKLELSKQLLDKLPQA